MSFGQRNLDREKPEIDFPEGDAPTELVITDLIEGAGAEVVPGSRVLTHYVGVAFSTGEEFDASWNRGEPLRSRWALARLSAVGMRVCSA